MKTNGNDSVNPIKHFHSEGKDVSKVHNGLTKREYFAAMAMQGLIAHNCAHFKDEDLHETGIAKRSVKLADALIKTLNEQENVP